ncbi:MAG: hypothetical protein OEY49_13810, partial [Candidatus Heimdallarchaeota archaeon]|nr:hypothetical protein [Candidatus Heimdallarchaeota archaeon]
MTTLNLAIIISLFMLIPFVVTLTFLIRLFRKYPSYSVVKVSMILIFTSIWCVSGLPWVLNVKDLTNQEIILIEKIGSILGLIGRIMFAVIFAKPNLGRKVYRFASVSFFSSTLLLGIRLLELIDPSINYYGIKKGNVWYQDYHPFIMIMLNLSIISLMLALVYGMSIQDKLSDDIVNPSLKSLNKIIVVLFFLAGVVSILNFTIVSINNYI